MYTGIKHLHATLAYILLLGVVISIAYSMIGLAGKKPYTEKSRKISLIGLISAHLQLVAGIVLYFVSPMGAANISGAAMKSSVSRLYILEHPLAMILGIVFITIGYATAKRLSEDRVRHKRIVLFYIIGLILILARIPWSYWP